MTQSNSNYDLAVIGSGGAAMAAGIHARQRGAKVVLIEQLVVGGTCVNVGCVPSKTLLAAAGARHTALSNPFSGAPTSAGATDFGALVDQKNELVGRLREAKYIEVAAAYGFEVLQGQASFDSSGALRVNSQSLQIKSQLLQARAYLIATGAEPAVPDLPGLANVNFLTSTTAMELPELPKSLVVIGAGYVGLEQAQLFAHLGVPVSVIGRVAPSSEPELASRLHAAFVADGITVEPSRAVAVESNGSGVVVKTESGRRLSGQRVLVATGRKARTKDLNLGAVGVNTDERGFISVDSNQRTTNPKIFAAGDVSGAPQYVYVAAAGGKIAAANALGGSEQIDYTGLPSVVFTRPQLASAGLSEAEALREGYVCDCRVLDLSDVPRALANRDTRGAVKVVAEAKTGKVLGVHALAEGAGEMMLAATYAIKAGFTVDQVADTWAPYLTMSEGLRITAGLFRNEMPTSCCA
jgi:mercuric reductase